MHLDSRLKRATVAAVCAAAMGVAAGVMGPGVPVQAASCIVPVNLTSNMFGPRPYGVSAQPAIDSTGNRIAFWSTADSASRTYNQDGSIELFMAVFDPLSGLSVQQVTTSSGSILGGFNLAPSLSGDGTRIAFFSDRNLAGQNPDGNFEIFAADIVSGSVSVSALTSSTVGVNIFPAISRNGRYVAFTSDRRFYGSNSQGAGQIVRAEIFSLGATPAYTGVTDSPAGVNNESASISEDGARIAYVSDEANPGSGQTDIYLAAIGADGVITRTRLTFDGANSQPAISADGTRIVWMNAPTTDGPAQVWSADIFSGFPITSQVSTQANAVNSQPAISDDALRVAYVSRPLAPVGATPHLWIYDYFSDSFTDYGPVNDSTRIAMDGQGGRVSYVSGRDALAVGCADVISEGRAADIGVSLYVSGPLAIANNAPVPGLPVTYTLLVNNNGPLRSLGGVITTTYPQSTTYAGSSPGCNDVGGAVVCAVGLITKNATTAPFVVFNLDSGALDTISNQVNLYGRYDVTQTNNVLTPPATNQTVQRVADMAIGKSALVTQAAQGDAIVYVINVTNTGPSVAKGVVVTDTVAVGTSVLVYDQTDDDVTAAGFGGGTRDAGLTLSAASGLSRIVGEPLPDGHTAGWVDMTAAHMLFHFDENPAGVPIDTSGTGNAVSCSPGCPTLGVQGVLTGAARFSSVSGQSWAVGGPSDSASLTFIGWLSTTTNTTSQVVYANKPVSCYSGALGGGSALRVDHAADGSAYLAVEYASGTFAYCANILTTAPGSIPTNQWVHVAMVESGSLVSVYINGRFAGSGVAGLPRDLQLVWSPTIGSYALGGAWFDGAMDEVVVLNRSMTADEIAAIYARQFRPGAVFESRAMDVGFPAPRTSLSWDTAKPYGKPLPDSGVEPAYPGGGQVDMTGLIPPVLHFDTQDPITGLYCFVSVCGTLEPEGRFGSALRMRGTSNYDSMYLYPRPGNIGNGDFTIEAWISTTQNLATSGAGQWWSGAGLIDADVGGLYNDFGLGLVAGRPTFGLGIQGVGEVSVAGSYVADGRWHHIAATRSSATSRIAIYVDGKLARDLITGQYAALGASGWLGIGAYASDLTSSVSRYDGVIDEAALYNRELSADEVSARYQRGAVRLRFQARTCPDATCAGIPYAGQGGLASAYLTDGAGAARAGGRMTTTLSLPANPVFQYRAVWDSLYPIAAPDLGFVQAGPRTTGIRASSGTCQDSGGAVTCAIPDMAVNATARITVPVVSSVGASVALVNVAQVRSQAIDTNLANNQASASVAANPVNLELIKTADRITATAGSEITYTIQVSNTSGLAATQVRVTDTLPAAVSVAGTIPSCGVQAGNLLVCTLGSLSAHTRAPDIIVRAVITSTARGALVNQATVSANESESLPLDNASTVTTPLSADAVLAVAQATRGVVAGAPATFTIVVTNTGPSSAGAVIVNGGLEATGTYTLSATPQASQGFCLPPQGNANYTCSLGDMAVGRSAVIMVAASVAPDAQGVLTTSAQANSIDSVLGGNSVLNAPIDGLTIFDFGVVSQPAPAVAGLPAVFTLTFTNTGPSRAWALVLTDTLPSALSLGDLLDVAPGLACTAGTPITCDGDGMDVGAARTIVFSATVDASAPAVLAEHVAIRSTVMLTDQVVTVNSAVASVSDVSTALNVAPSSVDAGRAVTYSLSADNAGPSTSHRTVLTLSLPVDTSLATVLGMSPLTMTYADLGSAVVFTATEHVPGQTITASLRVNVAAVADPGAATANLTPLTSSVDPQAANDDSSASFNVTNGANLSVTLASAPPTVDTGAALVYSLTLDNDGPSVARRAVMTFTLPPNTTYGALVFKSSRLNLTTSATRLVFAVASPSTQQPHEQLTATVRISVNLDAPLGPLGARLDAYTTSPEADYTDNTALLTNTVTSSADLSATLASAATSVNAGSPITFNLTMTNRGPSVAAPARMTFTLPSVTTLTGVPAKSAALSLATVGNDLIWTAAQQQPGSGLTATVVLGVDADAASGALVAQISVGGGLADPQPANNVAQLSPAITSAADLSVTVSSPSSGVNPGEEIVYQVALTNLGPSVAHGPGLTVTLPVSATGFRLIDATAGFGMSTLGNLRVWNDTLQLPGQVLTATFGVTVSQSSPPTQISLQVVGGSLTGDPNPANQSASLPTTLTYVGVGAVSVSGPTTGTAGGVNSFDAASTPAGATWPITYTWRTSQDATSVVHVLDAASDTFDINFGAGITGTFQVTVTARGPTGATRTDFQSITISP